jgi:hypothetical protein
MKYMIFAFRTGSKWLESDWVQVDLQAVKKVTKIYMTSPPSSRAPTTLRIDESKTGKYFKR